MTTTTRALRADAARNRQALLEAARTCFARDGAATQMDSVAASAGVGVGTLYRHFPTKTDLVHALFAERLASFVELVDACAEAAAWDRLAAVVGEMVRVQSVDRALADAPTCEIAATRPELAELRSALRRGLEGLIARAVADGAARADLAVDDVLALCFNRHLAGRGGSGWRTYAAIVIDGMRARPASAPAQP